MKLRRGKTYLKRRPLRRKPHQKPTKRRKPQKRKRGSLVKALDTVFSIYVRQSHAINGLVACYTCPTIAPIKKMQNGHYVSRSIRILRWSEDNCRPQCMGCNVFHGGRIITFRENLVKELGEDSVQFLEASRHTIFKPTTEWLEMKIAHYQSLIQ